MHARSQELGISSKGKKKGKIDIERHITRPNQTNQQPEQPEKQGIP